MQDRKYELQKALAIVVKKYRSKKSISLISNEIDLSKSIWSNLEKGEKDIQLSTFWRIAEALEVRPSILVNDIETLLGEIFTVKRHMV